MIAGQNKIVAGKLVQNSSEFPVGFRCSEAQSEVTRDNYQVRIEVSGGLTCPLSALPRIHASGSSVLGVQVHVRNLNDFHSSSIDRFTGKMYPCILAP